MSVFTELFNKTSPQGYYYWGTGSTTPHYFVLDNVRLHVTSIKTEYQIGSVDKPYIGGYGSYIGWTGEGAKKLSIPCKVGRNGIKHIIKLKNTRKPVPLVSPSPARYNGYYIVTGCGHTETRRGAFDVELQITEYIPPKVTGNLVTTADLENMSMTNMLRMGNTQALMTRGFAPGTSCRAMLKLIQGKKRWPTNEDYAHLFKKSPRCREYLVKDQCYYNLRNTCGGNYALFEKLYPKCKALMNLKPW